MIIAIIPAKLNSSRFPGKNIASLKGKPLLYYSIRAAIRSGIFDEVHVSTDSRSIKNIAEKYGAKVPFLRNKKLSDSKSTVLDVIYDHAKRVNSKCQLTFICCIYATAPLINYRNLIKSFKEFKLSNKFDYSLAYTKYRFPVLRSLKKINKKLFPLFPKKILKRSQDLPVIYHDAAQFFWTTQNAINKKSYLFGKKTMGFYIDPKEVIDIDYKEDYEFLKIIFKKIKK
ncbi:pseudaminic acid cytidylyltransferase [Candidatus Pelagibacter sp.]|jgi:pseudaminic acid cytidylyltransferase|nr:pseudaminic acid cytidylyltransferase [Candidatus Pelagibacter sp.]|tara:strand:+ start:390 stop:1073 length:684 start_codon:yes stop_codon:yes gene_type:complete